MPGPVSQPLAIIFPLEGLDTWESQFVLRHNILTDLRNIDWEKTNHAASLAKGRDSLVSGLAAAVIGLGRFTSASGTSPRSVAVLNEATVSWKVIDDAGTVSAVTLPITWASAATRFASFAKKNITIGVNGSTRPLKLRKDNLTAATRVGIDTPGTAPTVADGGAGNLNGVYQWRVTFESPTHESSPGPISTKLTLANRQVSLTNVPTSSDTQVTKRNIYRIGGVIPEWLYVGTINDNTTTTFTDNVSDLNLGEALTFDRDPPRTTLKGIIEHKSRAFAFDGNELLFSNEEEPEGWDPTHVLAIGGSSDIKGLGTTGSVLLVIKDTETWVLLGESIDDFVRIPAFKKGTVSGDSIVSAEGLVIWLSTNGEIIASDGRGIERIGQEVKGLINTLTLAQQRTGVGLYDASRYILSFPGQFTVILNLATKRWEVYPWTFDKGISAHDDNGLGQYIVTNGASATQLVKWPGAAHTDLGAGIVWYIERAGLAVTPQDEPSFKVVKRFREVEVIAPPQSGVSITLNIIVDGDTANKQYNTSVSLTNAPVRVGLPANMVGKVIKVKVSGTHSAFLEIHGLILWGWMEHKY